MKRIVKAVNVDLFEGRGRKIALNELNCVQVQKKYGDEEVGIREIER